MLSTSVFEVKRVKLSESNNILKTILIEYNELFETNITLRDLKSPTRKRDIADARVIIGNYLSRVKSFKREKTGSILNRNHSSITHYYYLVENTPFFKKMYLKFTRHLIKNQKL